jgi:broad specificity phosphatase PhoE
MRLILIRHGETACNLEDIWHGWDECELTERGLEQAAAVGARLAREPIAAVYSSDVRRALQTAQAIAAPHGLSPIPDPGLRERKAGDFEGKSISEVLDRYPAVWEERAADFWGWSPPGGETFRQVLDRALAVVERLRREHDGQTVAVVSHMGVVRALISRLGGIPIERTYDAPFPSTGVSVFTTREGTFHTEMLNDAGHVAHSQS